jgi:hypothetical protein
MPKKGSKSSKERYGFVLSAIGLAADLIALGTFGFTLINNAEPTTPISVALWIGILSIIPLTYFWGFMAWSANLKFGKPAMSILAIGLCIMPFFVLWGAIVVAEFFRVCFSTTINGVRQCFVMTDSRINGVISAMVAQIVLGLLLYVVVRLWNKLLASSLSNQ